MIRPEALTRLRLLVGAVRAPLVAGEPDRELPPLQRGQPIDGRVEQQFRAGYIVTVRGRSFEFRLPDGTRPGDLLRMVYVNDDPRPTFALLRIERANDQGESKLSDAGKLLAMLQEIPAEAGEEPAPREVAPVFQSRIPETAQAATLLREALTLSGLFYESHQAQWVQGTRSTEQLQREPQGKLSPMPAATSVETIELQGLPLSNETARSAESAHKEVPPALEPDQLSQPDKIARSPAHPDTFPIIRQQLRALESGHVAWRGMVWPDQFMEWQVGDGTPRPEQGNEVPRTWRTELKLTLPNMGVLLARIELDVNGARLHFVADSEPHARRLRHEAAALAGRFAASGIPMKAFEASDGSETT